MKKARKAAAAADDDDSEEEEDEEEEGQQPKTKQPGALLGWEHDPREEARLWFTRTHNEFGLLTFLNYMHASGTVQESGIEVRVGDALCGSALCVGMMCVRFFCLSSISQSTQPSVDDRC